MATRAFARDSSTGAGVGIAWAGLTNASTDDGTPFDTLDFADISIQVSGTFGVGGSLRIEGSNQATPTVWATLNDPQGNALDFTSAKIEQVLEMPRWIRPRITAGDANTSLACTLWARRSR